MQPITPQSSLGGCTSSSCYANVASGPLAFLATGCPVGIPLCVPVLLASEGLQHFFLLVCDFDDKAQAAVNLPDLLFGDQCLDLEERDILSLP